MIDHVVLHNAMAACGLTPDVPFHMTDSRHEMRLMQLVKDLSLDEFDPEENERLDRAVEDLETMLEDAQDEVSSLELQMKEAQSEIARLSAANGSAAE